MKSTLHRLQALTAFALATLFYGAAQAQWTFSPAVDIATGKAVFHHLEASGRQSLALSAGHVAIAWEDDRSGAPRCYLAIQSPGNAAFHEQAFGQGECFAPGLATLEDGRFAVIWEDEGGMKTAVVENGQMSAAVTLAQTGSQGALVWHPKLGLTAVWGSKEGRWQRMWHAKLAVKPGALEVLQHAPLEPTPPKDDQLYPALSRSAQGISLAWEDRRLGHTVIFTRHSADGVTWTPVTRASRNPTGKAQGTDLGRGTGAMRPVLAAFGPRLATVWLDKRDFLSGYDVYAALAGEDGVFGKDLKVQDSFGDAIAQWHPAVAGNAAGQLVVAWDDDRDGTSDIWLSTLNAEGRFTDNIAPGPASGPGAQTDPAVALDAAGNLHLVWVDRTGDELSRLRYSVGHQ